MARSARLILKRTGTHVDQSSKKIPQPFVVFMDLVRKLLGMRRNAKLKLVHSTPQPATITKIHRPNGMPVRVYLVIAEAPGERRIVYGIFASEALAREAICQYTRGCDGRLREDLFSIHCWSVVYDVSQPFPVDPDFRV